MRIIEPRQLPRKKSPQTRQAFMKWFSICGTVLIVLYAAMFAFRFTRPLPLLHAETKNITVKPNLQPLTLPIYGQVAAGAVGYGQLAKAGENKPQPMASIAKVVTALTVLDKKPLAKNSQGPTLTLDATDVELYNDYYSNGGSVVKVVDGEQITQYQALQALLLPSSNNMADSLARWSFGSVEEFIKAANGYLVENGLKQTTMADASGFSDDTVSTAEDLVALGELAVKNPVVAEIAAQSSAVIPVAGEISNVNVLLGSDGIDGIKTGNTDEAGGCFLTTVLHKDASGAKVRLIVAVMGAGTLEQAMQDARDVLAGVVQDFATVTLKAGTEVGYYDVPWAGRVTAVTKSDITLLRWRGTIARASINLQQIPANTKAGSVVGTARLTAGPNSAQQPVVLKNAVQSASNRWRFWKSVSF